VATATVRRHGAVTTYRKCFLDGDGVFNPRGITFFTWPWGLKHEPDRYRANAAWASARRFDFIRVFGKVGGGSWADREFNIATEEAAMIRAINVAYDDYGLRSDIALIADNYDERDPLEAAEALVRVIRRCGLEKILCVECANEDNMPNEDVNLPRVFRVLRDAFPALPIVARCAPMGQRADGSAFLEYDAYGYADVMSYHPDRTPPAERQIRQSWDCEAHPRVCGKFEGNGPWASGADPGDPGRVRETQPIHLAVDSFADSLVGSALVVYHAGAGIRTGGAWDQRRGLPANFWDQAQGEAQGDGITMARSLLPPDIADPSWRHINGHWADSPIAWTDNVSRIYTAQRGGAFYSVVIAVLGHSAHAVKYHCHLDTFNPQTGDLIGSREYRAGERITFVGPDAGGLWGYAVKGQVR
jgi:hypothetical protein